MVTHAPPSSSFSTRIFPLLLSLLSLVHHRCCNAASAKVVTTATNGHDGGGNHDDEYHGGDDDRRHRRRRRTITFLSGVADTHQTVASSSSSSSSSSSLRWHRHLVCFRRDGRRRRSFAPAHGRDARAAWEERKRCCSDLRRTGLLPSHYSTSSYSLISRGGRGCEDLIAMIPRLDDDVVPAFYLALVDEGGTSSKVGGGADNNSAHYRQNRILRVREDGEEESLSDGGNGVGAYSPFHLSGFEYSPSASTLMPLRGRVEGGLTPDDSGMHRAFRQKMRVLLDVQEAGGGGRYLRLIVNSTILLPISEGIFVDADDPLLERYPEVDGTVRGKHCGMFIRDNYYDGYHNNDTTSSATTTITTTIWDGLSYSSECDIEFVHPEIIDIEQPSFASRQHVVAYRIGGVALVDLPPTPPRRDDDDGSSSRIVGERWTFLEIVIEYGTMLHVRYPPPIVRSVLGKNDDGLVDVIVRHPVLYSASANLEHVGDDDGGSSIGGRLLAYSLIVNDFDKDHDWKLSTASLHLPPPDPIFIRVAVGMDADYWLVTLATMTSAIIGGMLVIWSLDSISVWC